MRNNIIFTQELPNGWRYLKNQEYPLKGDRQRGNPHIVTKQIWYMFFRDQPMYINENDKSVITQRPE
jgi:Fe-S cluster biosynthesis and repair protein YggX